MSRFEYPRHCPDCGQPLDGNVKPHNCPECNFLVLCPDCGHPIPKGAVYCPNEKCRSRKEGKKLQMPLWQCSNPACGKTYSRNYKFCPSCQLPRELKCNGCGRKLRYDDKFCPHCGTETSWNQEKKERSAAPAMQGGFVITPYGPMYVFDVPASAPVEPPKPVRPQPVEPEAPVEVAPAPVNETKPAPEEKKSRGIGALILSIIGVLLFPIFPIALIALYLGIVGREDHKGISVVTIIFSVIALLLLVAAGIWLWLGGWNWLMGLFGSAAVTLPLL